MRVLRTTAFLAALSLALPDLAAAQSTSITTGPNGELSSSVSVPGLPPMGVTAGNGQVSTTPANPPRRSAPAQQRGSSYSGAYAGPGRSVTVRSPDGSAVSTASVSGGRTAVAGAGSPGSTVTVGGAPRVQAKACPRGASKAYRLRTKCRLVRR